VDEAVDLVHEPPPLFRPILMFRHHRLLVLVEPVDHLDQRADRLELAAPDRFSNETQGRHETFELQMRVVSAPRSMTRLPRTSATIWRMRSALTRSSRAISS
jgi:hypothetical protein